MKSMINNMILFLLMQQKLNQRNFLNITHLLRNGGLVITDNVLYHGFVSNIDIVRSRNVKQMVQKVQKFNDWLISLENYSTNFINMDDGLAISIKGE